MTKVTNPQPIFLDARGALSDGGYMYIGTAGTDPETNPVTVYWDAAYTIPAAQPLRTMAGLVVNGATPAQIFINGTDYSMRLRDSDGAQAFYSPSVYSNLAALQPLNATLTAIAAQGSTPFGLSMLLLANQAALAGATGIPTPLPIAGGALTGNATRSGAGVLPYFFDPAMTGGRIFVTAAGAADPTSQPGDIWFKKQ